MGRVAAIARQLRRDDMLIVFAAPPSALDHELAIGVVGTGFTGRLTSESTHTNGLVVSTDIAPTILGRFGIAVPSEMLGQPISASGQADPGAIGDLDRRLSEIAPRRGPVIGVSMLIWAALALIATLIGRARAARVVLPLLAATVAYLPAVLLLTAAIDPSTIGERLIAGLGAPALAAVSSPLPGRGALALAAAATVGGYGIDVVAGSRFTSLRWWGRTRHSASASTGSATSWRR